MAAAARQLNMSYLQDNTAPRRRDKGPALHELPLVRPRRGAQQQVHTRVKVNLRPKEEVSFLPAIGLLAAAFMCVLIIISYSQLNNIYAQTVEARHQLTALEQEGKTLNAQYEEIFDKAAMEAAISSSGTHLGEVRSNQKIYVDLSEPDNAVVYHEGGGGLLDHVKDLFSAFGS
jgi:hypothetical protein